MVCITVSTKHLSLKVTLRVTPSPEVFCSCSNGRFVKCKLQQTTQIIAL